MSTRGEDELSRRLRAADPAPPSGRTELPSGRRIDELVEQTMASTTKNTTGKLASGGRWLIAAAVVAAAIAGAAAYFATSGGHTRAGKTVLSLKVPGAAHPHPGGATCIMFRVDRLAQQDVAFSGTVASLGDHSVKITVDHWYKGGNTDEVDLATVGTPGAVNELGVNFVQGARYLVSALDGTVTGCGYTGPYSSELARDFRTAFGS